MVWYAMIWYGMILHFDSKLLGNDSSWKKNDGHDFC